VGYRSYANDSVLRNVTIGRFCSICRLCSIVAALREVCCFTTHFTAARPGFVRDPETRIGNDVWIGDGVVIKAGVSIGDGAVIEAGTVIDDDVQPYAIVGGVPAQLQQMRFDAPIVATLLELKWWRYGEAACDAVPAGSAPRVLIDSLQSTPPRVQSPEFHPWKPG
jgi:acetyltransferase-like isoleucine patch superfamily enzyme